MKLLAAAVLSLSIVAGTASGQQTTIEGLKAMPTTEDIRAVAPALEKYAKGVVHGDLWKRPGLSARDRSIVTVAALIQCDAKAVGRDSVREQLPEQHVHVIHEDVGVLEPGKDLAT